MSTVPKAVDDMLYEAWCVIANVNGGKWSEQALEWQQAAKGFRERWHSYLGGRTPTPPDAQPEPRTPDETLATEVDRVASGFYDGHPYKTVLLDAAWRLRELAGALTFAELRAGNVARLPQFKNRRGESAHSQPDGSDWSLGEWSNAVMGELGEAANLIKKIHRGDVSLEEARGDLADELADVQCYLDILAFRAGVELGRATADKWNRVSQRVGSPLRIGTAVRQQLAQGDADVEDGTDYEEVHTRERYDGDADLRQQQIEARRLK